MTNWIAVASADHVSNGVNGGFMQVCHGKIAPLTRMKPGDLVAYYSPTVEFRGSTKLQAFTAIGIMQNKSPYQFDMGSGFCPFRRDIVWLPSKKAAIRPMLSRLEFSANNPNWGYQLRFGIFRISHHDMIAIAEAMNANLTQTLILNNNSQLNIQPQPT